MILAEEDAGYFRSFIAIILCFSKLSFDFRFNGNFEAFSNYLTQTKATESYAKTSSKLQ